MKGPATCRELATILVVVVLLFCGIRYFQREGPLAAIGSGFRTGNVSPRSLIVSSLLPLISSNIIGGNNLKSSLTAGANILVGGLLANGLVYG